MEYSYYELLSKPRPLQPLELKLRAPLRHALFAQLRTRPRLAWQPTRGAQAMADYKFLNRTGETLRREPGQIGGQAFELGELRDCEVLLLDNCDQVVVENLRGCKVFIGPSSGSVFVRKCTGCTFTIACKQFRTRDCADCTISLFVVGDPVIETSKNMR